MMRQALKIKCWDCEEVFTASAEVFTQPGGPLVNVVGLPLLQCS